MSGAGGEEALVRGLEQNLWELWANFGRGPDCRLHDEAAALWFETPMKVLPYNGVLRFRVDEGVDARIDAICSAFRARDVPFLWMVHPSARPHDLGERLRAHGVELVEECPGMVARLDALDAAPPAPPGFEVHEARGAAEVQDVLELVAWRWDLPPETGPYLHAINRVLGLGTPRSKVRIWVAWRDGAAVAKAVLHVAAGVAGLYGVATRPEARGLGLARMLTLRAFDAARAAGCELGVLHSSPMATRLYEGLGFRHVAPFLVHASAELRL